MPPRRHRPLASTAPSRQDQAEELLAAVAHELRRPLTALLGALATIQQRGPALSASQQQELLTTARRQGIQLQRLLEQLLVAAALDHPRSGVARPSLVDAAALATDAVTAAQLAHLHHQIVIQAAGPLLVWVDPLAITRILGNLLDNAATHAPPGSPIQLSISRDGTEVVLAVHDQGPGLPAEQRERIFQRYTRVGWHAGPAAGGAGARAVHRPASGPRQRWRPAAQRPVRRPRRQLRLPMARQHRT
jgi:signal transduction histidine kinase